MAKDPAFLFYSQDFFTGVATLTNEQVGKYIRLLCLQHQKGLLTEKDMLFICESYDEDIFCKFKKDSDGKYFNVRLRKEVEKRFEYSKSRSKNRTSSKSDNNKNNDNNHMIDICSTYVQHMENENEIEIVENRIGGPGGRKGGYEYPNLDQVKSYFIENGYSEQSAVKAFNYYSVDGWKDSNGKQVRNWKQKMQSVWFKDENKKQSGSSSIVFPR